MLQEGALLGGRYRIQGILGRGGMGEVYRATDERSNQQVALKSTDLGRWGPAQRESLLDQFRREGQTLLRLQHPNLPAFLDYLEEDEQAFLVMELVPGCNLAQRVTERGPLPEATLILTLQRLASVLEYLHGQSPPVIFRDLKPSNVMLLPDGDLKLIDFGLAKSMPAGSQEATQTSARGLVSPGFAAPEQYSGGTDERSDLYALGATAYYLATGTTPPESIERATSGSGLASPDRLNPELSSATALLITRLMQLKRDKRPASAGEVLIQLRLRSAGETHTVAVTRRPRKRRWKYGLGLVPVACLWWWWWWSNPGPSFPLHVESSPSGAAVYLTDQAVGSTPCNLTVTSKSQVRLVLPGFYPVQEQPAKFTRQAQSLFVRLTPGKPEPGVKQEKMPGNYPAGLGGPPWPLLPAKTAKLDGHAYGVFGEWSVKNRSDRSLVLQQGDGLTGPLHLARLESGPSGRLEDLLQAEIARRTPDWTVVRIVREEHSALAYFESRQGPVAGRAAWLLRLSPVRSLQLRVEITPCQDPFIFLRDLDMLRSSLRLEDTDPV